MLEASLDKLIERYELAARAGNEAIWDWDLREDVIHYSSRFLKFLGKPEADILASPDIWLDAVHPDDIDWLRATFQGQLGENAPPFHIEHRIRGEGGWRWLLCRGIAVPGSDGEPVRLVGSVTDVTERKRAEEALRLSEERYALAARGANDGLWDWNLETDEIYFSPRWREMIGVSEPAGPPTPAEWFGRVLDDDRAGLHAAVDRHLSGGTDHLEHEFRMRRADGAELWLLVRGLAVRNHDARAIRMAGSLTDITARKLAERQLLFDALHDGLTGLPNRTLLLDRIGQILTRGRRIGDHRFAVMLLDIDRFKSVNDSLGPVDGDQVLMTMAARLDKARRMGDTVARLSADEFGLLIDGIESVPVARIAAQRFADTIAQPIRLGERDMVLTCSIGIVLSDPSYTAPDDMLRDASLALVRAKSAGGARTELYDEGLRRRALDSLQIEADLRTAIEAGEMRLHYQPIVSLKEHRLAGFEALMRWQHPRRGLISPANFIPVAEETGQIVQLGRWALREAAQQISQWRGRGGGARDLFISVNVSGKQFRDDDLVSAVSEVFAANPGLDPSGLKLEITESLLMSEPEHSIRLMRALKDLGVRLSLDDFGTGYSSLGYLSRFPIDALKIDQSFVRGIGTGGGAEIVRIITALAKALRMDVIAEGVEQEAEASFLRGLPADYGQGYLFGRPMPASAADILVEDLARS
jgi:diguanylate cyclase (GGDEF)-like protein/PAS domain S-box-containing protein